MAIKDSLPRLFLFLDHENINFLDCPLRKVLAECVQSLNDRLNPGAILSVKVRAYGGWFNGLSVSDARYQAAQFYQSQLPSAFQASGHLCRLSFEFADFLTQNNDSTYPFRISHTVVKRGRPFTVSLKNPRMQCTDPNCALDQVKKWLRKARACFKSDCQHAFSDAFDRLEQKQVDVHIALDLV